MPYTYNNGLSLRLNDFFLNLQVSQSQCTDNGEKKNEIQRQRYLYTLTKTPATHIQCMLYIRITDKKRERERANKSD